MKHEFRRDRSLKARFREVLKEISEEKPRGHNASGCDCRRRRWQSAPSERAKDIPRVYEEAQGRIRLRHQRPRVIFIKVPHCRKPTAPLPPPPGRRRVRALCDVASVPTTQPEIRMICSDDVSTDRTMCAH